MKPFTVNDNGIPIVVIPSASDPSMIERWEMDLSPGIVRVPFNPVLLENIIMYYLSGRYIVHFLFM